MMSSERSYYWDDPTSTASSGNSGALGFSGPHGVDRGRLLRILAMKIMPVFSVSTENDVPLNCLKCQPKIALSPHPLTSSFDATRPQVEDKQLDGG